LFTVKGKGGLVRLIYLTKELARALEARRRPVPIMVTDRKRRHRSYYDIAGGDAWGAAFRKAAIKVYGESPGAHSTRHGYVLNRRRTLEQLGLGIHEIRSIISQELGHFRPEIVRESYEHEPWVPRAEPR
jgi:integrase